MTTTTTPTVYHLRAQTDKSTSNWHLGAAEKGAVCFCGARLMEPGDERKFAAKYPADERRYETSPDLSLITCGACKRTAAWRISAATGSTTVGIPARPERKAKAAEAAPATGQARPRKRPSAKAAADAVSGGTVIEKDPETGLPRIKPEYAAKAERIAADQAARNAG